MRACRPGLARALRAIALRGAFVAVATLATLATGSALAGDGDAQAQARALLAEFDAHWTARDVDGLMQAVSPSFGCELFGAITVDDLRKCFRMMLDQMPGTTAHTEVLDSGELGPVVYAFVERTFAAGEGEADAHDWLLFYLRREAPGLRIVGLEDFDPARRACSRAATWDAAELGLKFDLPQGMLAVPVPLTGSSVEHLRLRGDALTTEIDVLLIASCDTIDLDYSLDVDLQTFADRTPRAKVLERVPETVAGFPARRAEVQYDGGGCSLTGDKDGAASIHRLTRHYVRVDDTVLFVVDLRAAARDHAARVADVDRMLASLKIAVPPGQSYGAFLAARAGDPMPQDGTFVHRATGFRLKAPPGFELTSIPSNSLFTLRARRAGDTSVRIRIDAVPLGETAATLRATTAMDDAAFCEKARILGTQSAIESENLAGIDGEGVRVRRSVADPALGRGETVVYVKHGAFLFTLRACGSPEELERARADLDAVLGAIRFAPP